MIIFRVIISFGIRIFIIKNKISGNNVFVFIKWEESISKIYFRQNKIISCSVWCPLLKGNKTKNMNMYYLLIFSFFNVPSNTFKHVLWTSLVFLISEHQMDMETRCAMKHSLLLLKICADRFYSIIFLKLYNSQCHYGINPLQTNIIVNNFYYSGCYIFQLLKLNQDS